MQWGVGEQSRRRTRSPSVHGNLPSLGYPRCPRIARSDGLGRAWHGDLPSLGCPGCPRIARSDGLGRMRSDVHGTCKISRRSPGRNGDLVCRPDGMATYDQLLMNAFDECFKEVRMIFVKQGVICFDTMEKKWKEQRVSEFDALGRRLRLVIQNSLNRR
ncbi:hypothetical protein F3Y22_tig00116962pilonHSYRG00143 [Hibiscus syriacus]|uniref:Uncharacterized protein n=1 Tax=Hibiscus syriacus TaxID=106335 RepID=A0A6A2WJ87_HIBSY|nr:hypothetical protein F3Y22_tig00116962pilonHSYRG00143 [Hibiscus syriacus]